jgi:tetratricopeptide (TPR) repeat protein
LKKLILCLALTAAVAAASDAEALTDEAAWLFFNRHLGANYLDSAAGLLQTLRQENPDNERIAYLWSRLHITLGDKAGSKARKLELFTRAQSVAESLIALNDENADGHCWWAVARGRVGQTRGVLNSLFMVPGLKKEMARTLELDPENRTAYDVLGVLYYELPGFAGGDLGKSEEYLLKGIEIAPDYTILRIDLAKVYQMQKRWAEAREQLQAVLDATEGDPPADYFEDDRPEAEKLLREIPEE